MEETSSDQSKKRAKDLGGNGGKIDDGSGERKSFLSSSLMALSTYASANLSSNSAIQTGIGNEWEGQG